MKKYLSLPTLIISTAILSSCTKNATDTDTMALSKTTVESVVKDEKTKTVTSSLLIDVDQDVFLGPATNGEVVHLTGQLHLVMKFFPNDPLRLFTNVISLKGTGLTSGLPYYISGSFESSQTVTGSIFSFTHSYRLLPPNPIFPTDPLRFQYTVEFGSGLGDVFGAVTATALPSI